MEIWPFEVVGALGTTVATKAWRRLDGLSKKNMSWNLVSVKTSNGTYSYREYHREKCSPSSLPNDPM